MPVLNVVPVNDGVAAAAADQPKVGRKGGGDGDGEGEGEGEGDEEATPDERGGQPGIHGVGDEEHGRLVDDLQAAIESESAAGANRAAATARPEAISGRKVRE